MSGTKKVGNFTVSVTDKGVIINDINGLWQIKFSPGTYYHDAICHHATNADNTALVNIINAIYYAQNTCITDATFIQMVYDYANEKIKANKVEVSDEQEAEDIEAVKDIEKLKEEVKDADKE